MAIRFKWFLVFLYLIASHVDAKLSGVQVDDTQNLNFGDVDYEVIQGRFLFQFDPSHPQNQHIVDLNKANTNSEGNVEAAADFYLIQPRSRSKRKGMLIEISNRGSKASMRYFNQAPRNNLPATAEALGDGLVQRLGLSTLWVGWQPDVLDSPENMNVELPSSNQDGFVRSDWTVETHQAKLRVAHRDQISVIYPVDLSNKDKAYLTVRSERDGLRKVIPKNQWQFGEKGEAIIGSFAPGIYELVYPSASSLVIGLGQALIRDTAEFVKTEDSDFYVPKTIAFGVSQTGRWLRHFLYQGFNQTESGEIAFDGMLIHTAGAGRGSFNHRFAQPSRDAHRMSAFFYPTDLFPFTSQAVNHPVKNEEVGLLAHLEADYIPKIYVTNTGYEYWGRAAGLIHSYNDKDVAPHPKERIFHLASGQHFVESYQGLKSIDGYDGYYQGNPLNFLLSLRALLTSLTQWVTEEGQPLPSQYPTFKAGTLTTYDQYQLPKLLQSLSKPISPHTAYLADYGSNWEQGIVDNLPPRILAEFVPPLPAVDSYGNEIGGIRHPLLDEPLATFLPWVLRHGKFANEEMLDFRGSTKLMSKAAILKRYSNWQNYRAKLDVAIEKAISEQTLLVEDKDKVILQAKWLWQKAVVNGG